MALTVTKNSQLLSSKKDYLDVQFNVHSNNLSRSDIPGAKSKIVEPFSNFLEKDTKTTLKTTNKHHLKSNDVNNGAKISTKKSVNNIKNSNNAINANDEMSKISEIVSERRAITELQKSQYSLYGLFLR